MGMVYLPTFGCFFMVNVVKYIPYMDGMGDSMGRHQRGKMFSGSGAINPVVIKEKGTGLVAKENHLGKL